MNIGGATSKGPGQIEFVRALVAMGTHSNEIEKLLPLVYGTATSNQAWEMVCDALNKLIGVPVLLFSHDITTYKCLGLLGAGWDPDHLDNYEQHFSYVNPWMDMNDSLAVGFVGVSDHAVEREKLFKTEFYNDWLKPQENLVVAAAAICYRKKDRFLALGSACPAKNVEKTLPDVVKTLKFLGPHISRAIEMSAVLKNGKDGSLAHLQTSRHAIISVRNSGRISGINPAAEKLLRNSPGLPLTCNGKFSSNNERVRQFIENAIHVMESQTGVMQIQPLAVSDAVHNKFLMHAHVFPRIAKSGFPEIIWHDPLIGCFVITGQAGLEDFGIAQLLVSSFGATPAEARLGQALMAEQSLYEYAEINTLSKHTVRNQMRALLAKTNSRNQMAFVLNVARLISPFE